MFNWIKKLFGGKRKKNQAEETFDYGDWENIALRRQDIDITMPGEREKYVRALLDQTTDIAGTLEDLNSEYAKVTSYLKDVEEVEALPDAEYQQLYEHAARIISLEQASRDIPDREKRMSEEEYRQMELFEPESEIILEKLRKNEEYRELVKRDLHRLHAERQAYGIRKQELQSVMYNLKGMSMICVASMGCCLVLLLLLQFVFRMDVAVGYILAGLVMAGVLAYVYFKYNDAASEYQRIISGINKLILLQNRVKIRYVNNTNLLDYLYTKYQTESSSMFERQLELFREEYEYRKQYERVVEDLSFYRKEMLKMLKRYQLFDPLVFLHHPEAVIDSRERVELRHGYNEQRQKLRVQMEHNQGIADRAKKEIKNIVAEYPEYAPEILAIVEEYE